ncbi:hypothetical protein [Intestinimonas timonensis]|uniref:hypothetical protein n=1 Tax=Intestinimonas timonensis TaxID=1689270 RepID=UPI00102F6DF8|nr:hypothetical protein [Intestinimonas timonensis]
MSIREIEAKARELRQLQQLIEEAQAEAEAIKDQIKAHMGEAEEMRAGEYKITWKPVTSSRLDSKALKAAAPELVERFTKSCSWYASVCSRGAVRDSSRSSMRQ